MTVQDLTVKGTQTVKQDQVLEGNTQIGNDANDTLDIVAKLISSFNVNGQALNSIGQLNIQHLGFIRGPSTAAQTYSVDVRDVDGAAWIQALLLTAGNDPKVDVGLLSGGWIFHASTPVVAAKIGPTVLQQHTLPAVASDTFALVNAAQTLVAKTLTTPTIGDFTNAAHNHQAAAGGAKLDHGLALNGLLDDDHTQYVANAIARTISAVHTFNPGAPGAPFVLGANATGQLVVGLNADQLDGQTGAFYQDAANITAGILALARGGTGSGVGRITGIQSGAGAPTTTNIPASNWVIWKDTTGGTIRLYVNDAGTLKNVELVA